MENPQDWAENGGSAFTVRGGHRQWLREQADRLLVFFGGAIDPKGGFYALDGKGQPLDIDIRNLHDTTRMVHCYALGKMMGAPGAGDMVDHGMDFLWNQHRDQNNGGYYSGVSAGGVVAADKLAYGHAFVLLAASSAKAVKHPDADRLLYDVMATLTEKFWDSDAGASREEFSPDWQPISNYRGQNANMHLCEALMAAFEVTQDQALLAMAESIADLIIRRHAASLGWRVAEHFDIDWQVDRSYEGDPMFRPAGVTPGHALEWSRLLVQLWHLGGQRLNWMLPAAVSLFGKAVETGWDCGRGGFFYTLDWDDRPDQQDKFWWPCAEGIGAASALGSIGEADEFETWYRRIWGYVDRNFIDHGQGGWWPNLDAGANADGRVFVGKPDIYHALQACLIPLFEADGSVAAGLLKQSAGRV